MTLKNMHLDKTDNIITQEGYVLLNIVVIFIYFFVLFIICISAASVTHEDLLFDCSIALKFTGINVPLRFFYFVSPLVVVSLFYLTFMVLRKKILIDSSLIVYINKKIYKIRFVNSLFCNLGRFYIAKKNNLLMILPLFLTYTILTFIILFVLIYSFLPYHDYAITYFQKIWLIALAFIALTNWKYMLLHSSKGVLYIILDFLTKTIIVLCTIAPILMCTLPSEHKFLVDRGLAVGNYFVLEEGKFRPKAMPYSPSHFESVNEFLWKIGLLKAYRAVPRNLDLAGKTIVNDANYKNSIDQILTAFVEPDKQIEKYVDIKPARVSFTGRDLQGANFSKAIFCNADFINVNLSNADFQGARLYSSSFKNSNMQGAYLWGINGRTLVFSKVNLSYTHFQESIFPGVNFRNCDMSFSDFGDADLTASDIYKCNVSAVNFTRAVLDGAKFINSYIYGCIFRQASMSGTILSCEKVICCDFRLVEFNSRKTSEVRKNFNNSFPLNSRATQIHCIYNIVPAEWNFPKCNLELFDYSIYKTMANIMVSCRFPDIVSNIFMDIEASDIEGIEMLKNQKRAFLTRIKTMQRMTCGQNIPLPAYTALQIAETVDGLESLFAKGLEDFPEPGPLTFDPEILEYDY